MSLSPEQPNPIDSNFAKWCENHGIEYSDPEDLAAYSTSPLEIEDLADTELDESATWCCSSGFANFYNGHFHCNHEDVQQIMPLEGHKCGDVLHQTCGCTPQNGNYPSDSKTERGFWTDRDLSEMGNVLDDWYSSSNTPDHFST